MLQVLNLSRREAQTFCEKGQYAWISIGEPVDRDGGEFHHISNNILDRGPKLKIKFWDLSKKTEWGGVELFPPTKEDAKEIVDFILKNADKDIIAQCAMGISRSSAIALFCEDLGYKWVTYKDRAVPNMHLYRMMVDYYNSNSVPIVTVNHGS